MDTDLVVRAQRGDGGAYAVIAEAIADRFLAVARRILRDIDLAEDATQQALIAIWQDLPKLKDPARFDAWSYRLLVHACYAEGRRHRRWAPNLQLLTVDAPTFDAGLGSVVDRDQLESGFRRLPIARDGPSDAMLGGYPARKVVLVSERPCSGPEGSILTVGPRQGDTIAILDAGTLTIHVVDVEGQRLVISTFSRGSNDAEVAELEGVVASLAIERQLGATPTIGPLFPRPGPLEPGRHDATVDGVLFSFELPSPRWASSGINSARNGGWISPD